MASEKIESDKLIWKKIVINPLCGILYFAAIIRVSNELK
jgi:hypothetical protein